MKVGVCRARERLETSSGLFAERLIGLMGTWALVGILQGRTITDLISPEKAENRYDAV